MVGRVVGDLLIGVKWVSWSVFPLQSGGINKSQSERETCEGRKKRDVCVRADVSGEPCTLRLNSPLPPPLINKIQVVLFEHLAKPRFIVAVHRVSCEYDEVTNEGSRCSRRPTRDWFYGISPLATDSNTLHWI